MAASRQRSFEFRTWGGKRKGAGRKPTLLLGQRPHRRVRKRARLSAREPVHVVCRVTKDVGRLRRRRAYQAIRRAMVTVLALDAIRIVHLSIQSNHLHLLVEAEDEQALARGMQGFAISAARHLNRAVAVDRRLSCPRRGQVFVTRYHAEIIDTPRRARHALAYVLNNWRRHQEHLGGGAQRCALVDPYSTGIHFDGWRGRTAPFDAPPGYEPLPAAPAKSWLLTVGWRRHTRIDPFQVPGPVEEPAPLRRFGS